MINRLTASAAVLAILATATIAFATEGRRQQPAVRVDRIAAAPMEVVQLPTVMIVGHRAR